MVEHTRATVLIPAAGVSRRFAAAGYAGPKALLRVDRGGGETARGIEHLLAQLRHWTDLTLVGVRSGDLPLWEPVRSGAGLVVVGERTEGQSDTLRRMLPCVPASGPVLVVNCDVLPLLDLTPLLAAVRTCSETAVLVRYADSEAMSYVDRVPYFRRTAEKLRISRWGLLGVYAFASVAILRQALSSQEQIDLRHGGELYLSGALGLTPGRRYAIVCEEGDVLDWGTPEALEATGARIVA